MRIPLGHGSGHNWRRYLSWLTCLAALLTLYALSWILLLRFTG